MNFLKKVVQSSNQSFNELLSTSISTSSRQQLKTDLLQQQVMLDFSIEMQAHLSKHRDILESNGWYLCNTDITLGFTALLSNHVKQNLCLMLTSYSLLLIIHFFLGRLALKLVQSQEKHGYNKRSVGACCVLCGFLWAGYSE